MFTRRMLRISAMQNLYGFYTLTKNMDTSTNQQEQPCQGFDKEIQQLQHIHLQLLQLLLLWGNIDEEYHREAQLEQYHNLNDNTWLQQLKYDERFQDLVMQYNMPSLPSDVLQLSYYERVRNNPVLVSYRKNKHNNMKQDAAVVNELLAKVMFEHEGLQRAITDHFAEWSRYQDSFALFLGAFIRRYPKQKQHTFDMLHNNKYFDKDRSFYRQLVSSVIEHSTSLDQTIQKYAVNWQGHRIFLLDRILIKLGIAESRLGTPIPVVINEYIEIAKIYSTPKSYQFVHGLLDKIIHIKLPFVTNMASFKS